MFCKNCGSKLKDNALFCSNCGNKVIQKGKVEDEFENKRSAVSDKGKNNRIQIVAIALSIIVIGVIGVVVANLSKPKVVYSYDELNQTASVMDVKLYMSEQIEIPNEIKKDGIMYIVDSIGESAFEDCSNLKSITLPSGLQRIEDRAFSNCTSIKSITIPSGVKSIGKQAFYMCTSLKKISIPASCVAIIGEEAFCGCKELSMVIILPSTITNIEKGTFAGCESLESINLPLELTILGEYAFKDCIQLTKIQLPYGVTSISESAFEGCTNLAYVEIPDTVTNIGDSAFAECKSLSNLTISEHVTNIGDNAFIGCDGLVISVEEDTSSEIKDKLQREYENTTVEIVFMGGQNQTQQETEQENQVQIPTQDKYNSQGVLLKWIEKLDIVDDSNDIVGEVFRYNNSANQTYYNEVTLYGGDPILNFNYSSKESLEYYLTPYGDNEVNLCSENGDYMLQAWIYENGINEDWHFTDNFITNLGMNYGWVTRPANGFFFEDRNAEYVRLIFEVDDGNGKKGYEGVLYEKNKETILHFVYVEDYSVYNDERAREVVNSISTNIIQN